MRPSPARLRATYGAQVVEPITRATFLAPDGTPLPAVDVLEGVFTSSAGRWPRDEVDLQVPVNLTATTTAPPVSAYGGRLLLEVGARVPGVGELLLPLASLDVSETTIERPDNVITVRAVSHEARVNEDRYGAGEVTAAGTTSSVVIGLVRRTLGPSWPVQNLMTSDPVLEAGAVELSGADVWGVVDELMTAAGAEAFFDPAGTLVLRPTPSKATDPAQVFRTGEQGAGTLTGYASTRGWAPSVVRLRWVSNEARPGALRYKWEATRTATPGTGHVSVNTADPRNASTLYAHRTSTAGTDVAESFAGIAAGDTITVVQVIADGPDKRLRYVATGAPTFGASVVSIPVDLTKASGSEPVDESAVEVTVRIAEHARVGVWQDTSTGPSSVTGPYGRHVATEEYRVERGTLPTQAAADAAALAMARRQAGAFRTVNLRTVPAPWVEPGDTVRVEFLGGSSETLQVRGMTLDLTQLDVMLLDCRDYAYTATL